MRATSMPMKWLFLLSLVTAFMPTNSEELHLNLTQDDSPTNDSDDEDGGAHQGLSVKT